MFQRSSTPLGRVKLKIPISLGRDADLEGRAGQAGSYTFLLKYVISLEFMDAG